MLPVLVALSGLLGIPLGLLKERCSTQSIKRWAINLLPLLLLPVVSLCSLITSVTAPMGINCTF